MADWVGDTNSVMKTLGSRWNCLEDRSEDDYYATDPKAIDCLLKVAKPFNSIWECACGEGHLSKRLIEYGFDVYSSDLRNRGFGVGGGRLFTGF